ncbi:MAG: hypothetical protein CM15mV123_220 [uncultured marine virus]|nr:MAG: hypothetical protein CM15mV123_220 [uncultured marine virus]
MSQHKGEVNDYKNSTLVANFEATPQIASNSQELHGVLRVAQER